MEIVTITKENLEQEHICCAIANNKDCQVVSKKAWLLERLDDGLVFKKGNVRGKCFIEYIPAEKAWSPIKAEGYMFINCFWVSGKFKGQGNGQLLLEECIADSKAKGKKGLAVLSSNKKMPFLSDPKFLKAKGFQLADTAKPFFELLYLPLDQTAVKPGFKPHVKNLGIKAKGFTLYYTHQCPFNAKYVPLIEDIAKMKNIPFQSICLITAEEAQNAPTPFTTYSLFYNGEFLTNEILSDKKFQKVIDEKLQKDKFRVDII
ncbi:GNAT family N-acetyltransferase [Aminipila sp.]|uniref:GNAT family N-acetyltransferase n=1 Tax=Aminipila sp. TaxID=2060095 RepID=UPI002898D08F|nr:YoaP domain-containing protein [Aminipila sp.]